MAVKILRIALVVGLATFFLLGCEEKNSSIIQPNIVLIMADDMGYECVGANGNTAYNTPALERLASAGLRFSQCYSQPLCTPSRVKIMTGKYNFRNYEDFGYLNPQEQTFGNLLQAAGYETVIAGKWQLNGLNRNNPRNQEIDRPNLFGFDEYCLWQLNHRPAEGERYADPLLTKNGMDLPRDPDGYGPQVMVEFLTDFIDRKAGKPFFIYYPMLLPHDPFVPTPDSPEWADPDRRYEKDTAYFTDMVAYIDKIVLELETKLKEKGVWENTLFIFTADNGTHPSIRTSTNLGKIRGAKGQSINTGNHVPMIVSWPAKQKKASVVDDLIDFADFLPTLAEAAGIDPESYRTDGTSFLGLLTGEQPQTGKEELFIHYSPRWGKWTGDRWVMNTTYKLYQDGRFYNTRLDPLERKPLVDLSDSEKELKQKFDQIIQQKEAETPFEMNNTEFIRQPSN